MTINKHQMLAQKIRKAFGNLEYPGDENIVYDNSSDYDELVETAQSFRGIHWTEASLETLKTNFERIPFFSDEATRFYLPAYMIATLLHFDEVGSLAWNTVRSLTPYEDRIERLNHIKTISDAQQKAVIREFLQAYADLDPDFYEYSEDEGKLDRLLEFWH